MILMIDNYDSFTYNLYQYIGELYPEIQVVRNDEITVEEIAEMKPQALILSPGPGYPKDAGVTIEAIRAFSGTLPILGICLGHQLLGLALGAACGRLKFGHHGCNHPVKNLATGAVEITSQNHSYAVDTASVEGTGLEITHVNLLDGTVEGLRCEKDGVFSVQYHPESAPGPEDSGYLFRMFTDEMQKRR